MKNKILYYRKKRKEKMFLLASVFVIGLISFGITLSAYTIQKKKENNENKIVYNSSLSKEQKKVAENLVKELEKFEAKELQDESLQSEYVEIKEKVTENKETEKVVNQPEIAENVNDISTEIVAVSTKPTKELKLIKPVEGKIGLDFSNDKVVYLKTLDEWGIHCGIDFLADVGTQVMASSDGVVQKIYEDNEFGVSIVIEHESGLVTKYSGVEANSLVQVGDEVGKGDVIAKIAKPLGIERDEGSHLHFEILKNDVNIRPTFE